MKQRNEVKSEETKQEGFCQVEGCKKKSLEYTQFCQKHFNENKKQLYQEELKDVTTIYVAGVKKSTNRNWDAGIWRSFNLFYVKDGKLERIFFGDSNEVPHYNNKKMLFENSVLGMDRIFDIVYGLSYYLFKDGYKLKEEFLSWEN